MKKQLLLTLFLLLLLFGVTPVLAQDQTVTLLHFSDYHAHAVPFYGEGEANTAGIARLIAYLKPLASDPNVLVFSGGDTMNLGSPAWSDKYQCAEWSWLNGLVDAMAFGNHDADYGPDMFAQCRSQINYPILGANVLSADGQANNIQLLADPANPAAGYAPLDPTASYLVATTDFQGLIAGSIRISLPRPATWIPALTCARKCVIIYRVTARSPLNRIAGSLRGPLSRLNYRPAAVS